MHLTHEMDGLKQQANPYIVLTTEAETELVTAVDHKKRIEQRRDILDHEVQHLLFWNKGFSNQGLRW